MREMDHIVSLQAKLDADWWSRLAKKENGSIIGDERNVLRALRTAPELKGLVRFNEFTLAVEFTRNPPWREVQPGDAWTDDDDTALMGWLQDNELPIRGKGTVADCVPVVAKDTTIHPVREYLSGLEWDDVPRLDTWLADYLGAEGDARYLAAVGRCWLVSAVARVMRPGCKADYVLVLESGQGVQKSKLAAAIAIRPEWFADNIGDIASKDSAIQLAGKWILELAELSAIRRAEVEAVKAYLTRTHDVFRPPYGRRAITVPRQCVFLATTNERQYLRDRTGNRRYWPVRCTAIDIEAFERDRDQIWAEAAALYEAGVQWYLTPDLEELARAEQEDRVHRTELETTVALYLADKTTVTTKDVFVFALGLDPNSDRYIEQTKRLGTEVAAAIETAGWERDRRIGRDKLTCYRKQK